MDKEVRHPYMFTLCGFVLCIIFAGNLARAAEPFPVFLNMSDIAKADGIGYKGNGYELDVRGYVQVYGNPLNFSSEAQLRVFPGGMGMQTVNPGEWIAVSLMKLKVIYPCKTYQGESRLESGQGVLVQSVVITPRLTVEGDTTVCRMEITAAAEN